MSNGARPPAHRHAFCRGAVAFLAQEASTRDYRLDAVHLGICLLHYGVLGISGDSDAGGWAGKKLVCGTWLGCLGTQPGWGTGGGGYLKHNSGIGWWGSGFLGDPPAAGGVSWKLAWEGWVGLLGNLSWTGGWVGSS